jgi:uncharacterized protein (DUF1778 family)
MPVPVGTVYVHAGARSKIMARSADTRSARDARINVRASARQEQIIRAAAAATDTTVTEFVLGTAVAQAEKVLADRRYFLADDEQWAALEELLSLPVPATPRLAALLARPDFFTDSPT